GEEEIPGIGTLVLAAVAREHGHRVHIVDGKRTGTPVEAVAQQVAGLAPAPGGFPAMTVSVAHAARIAARVAAPGPGVVTAGARRGGRFPSPRSGRSRASTTASSARASARIPS